MLRQTQRNPLWSLRLYRLVPFSKFNLLCQRFKEAVFHSLQIQAAFSNCNQSHFSENFPNLQLYDTKLYFKVSLILSSNQKLLLRFPWHQNNLILHSSSKSCFSLQWLLKMGSDKTETIYESIIDFVLIVTVLIIIVPHSSCYSCCSFLN
jgi:hypothetical protein